MQVRRLLSIPLLAVLLLPLLAPLLALGQGGEAGLPACCRRDGRHHCMAGMDMAAMPASRGLEWRARGEKCPFCPAAVSAAHPDRWSVPPTAQAVFAALVSHPGGTPQTESRRRISQDRARGKRGPPAHILL